MPPTGLASAWRSRMTDLLYLGMAVGFFALSWALIRLCERL